MIHSLNKFDFRDIWRALELANLSQVARGFRGDQYVFRI